MRIDTDSIRPPTFNNLPGLHAPLLIQRIDFSGKEEDPLEERQDQRRIIVVVPANRTKQEVPNWVGNAEQDSVYKCICELFEMGAKFTRTASGFEVVYPAEREIEGKQFESVLRLGRVQVIAVADPLWAGATQLHSGRETALESALTLRSLSRVIPTKRDKGSDCCPRVTDKLNTTPSSPFSRLPTVSSEQQRSSSVRLDS
jgi:hypothetical protein